MPAEHPAATERDRFCAVVEAARLYLDADSAALLRPSKDTESEAVKARNALRDALSRV